jgi:hypothetical protein
VSSSSSSSSSSQRCIPNPSWRLIEQKTPGATVTATVQVGDNDAGGTPEYSLSDCDDDGQRVWDSNLTDGFDSGDVNVCLVAGAGGGEGAVAWSVGGGVLQSDKELSTIRSVEIDAAAINGWTLSWSQITITFMRNGIPVQVIMIPDECRPSAEPFEQILQINPNSQNCTSVTVTAVVRITGPATLPNAGGVSGAISIS